MLEIFARNKGYPLSLFYDLTIFYLQQSESDPGVALSLYHTPRNKSDDDTGERIRDSFCCVIFFQEDISACFFDQLFAMVFPDDRILVLVAKDDLQKSQHL